MAIDKYTRGVPTYKGKDDLTYGLLCETKEECITDANGVGLSNKLEQVKTNKTDIANIQTKIDNIQTTSTATLSQAGWYRVATYSGTSNSGALGNRSNSCEIILKRTSSSNSGTYKINLNSRYNSQEFKAESVNIKTHDFTKIRYVYNTSTYKTYIEVYNNTTTSVTMTVIILEGADDAYKWTAITPTLTSETVSGVTVTTTYDIPANASPVTDLDLNEWVYPYSSANTEDKLTEVINGFFTNTSNGAIRRDRLNVSFTSSKLGSGTFHVETCKKDDTTGWQKFFGYKSGKLYCERTLTSGAWSDFYYFATTADLANYLPKSGGILSGNLEIGTTTEEKKAVILSNAKRRVWFEVESDGTCDLWDTTKGKAIFSAKLDGTNTFNGTATGNLPLNGGGTVTVGGIDGFAVARNSENMSCIAFQNTKGYLGYLGVDKTYNPVFRNTSGVSNVLHHDGNSAKVAIQSTAPTDTSALWVDSTNKKTKAYIDGAWTALA